MYTIRFLHILVRYRPWHDVTQKLGLQQNRRNSRGRSGNYQYGMGKEVVAAISPMVEIDRPRLLNASSPTSAARAWVLWESHAPCCAPLYVEGGVKPSVPHGSYSSTYIEGGNSAYSSLRIYLHMSSNYLHTRGQHQAQYELADEVSARRVRIEYRQKNLWTISRNE